MTDPEDVHATRSGWPGWTLTVVETDGRSLVHRTAGGDTWSVEDSESPWGQPVLVCRPPEGTSADLRADAGVLAALTDAAAPAPGPTLVLADDDGPHRLTWEPHAEVWDVTTVRAGGTPTFVVRVQLRGTSRPRIDTALEHAVVRAACAAVMAHRPGR